MIFSFDMFLPFDLIPKRMSAGVCYFVGLVGFLENKKTVEKKFLERVMGLIVQRPGLVDPKSVIQISYNSP